MAGLTERGSASGDTFWSWRDRMYGFLSRLDPGHVGAVAEQLYVELLRHGYTGVCEFHYLRNAPDGRPYETPAEMAWSIVAAAQRAGVGLTMLPVLYRTADFGGEPAGDGQRPQRFADNHICSKAGTDLSTLASGCYVPCVSEPGD